MIATPSRTLSRTVETATMDRQSILLDSRTIIKLNLAIWWYTFPSFIYSMLNDALRMLEAGAIINMGFFIYDLHHQLKQLHQKQVDSYQGKSFPSLPRTMFIYLGILKNFVKQKVD